MGGITSGHVMAETVPFVKPVTIVSNSGFFGPSMGSLPIFGKQLPPSESNRVHRQLRIFRNIGVLGINLVDLSVGSLRDTSAYIDDVDRLEHLAGVDVTQRDDRRLLSLLFLARDHVVHDWVLASGSFMLCAMFNVFARSVWASGHTSRGDGIGQCAIGRGGATTGQRGVARPECDTPAGRTGGAP